MSDQTFTPSIFYREPRAALEWLQQAFGFELTMLIDSPEGDPRMIHSEMCIDGRGRVMVGGEWAEWARSCDSVGGANTQSVHVHIETDVDAHCNHARLAGAVIVAEPATQFYGARTYRVKDLEGHVWTFAQEVAALPSREEAERMIGARIQAKDWP